MLNTLALGATLIGAVSGAHLTPEAAKTWSESGRAHPQELKGFTVGMVMKDFPLLERTLDEVSNPKSKRYGQWLSKEEADAITATPDNIAAEVKAWATSTGAHCERKPEAFSCTGTVKSIEKLLNGELSNFVNHKTGETIIRTSMKNPGSIPVSLTGKVTIVTGLTQLPMEGLRAGKTRPFASYTAGADYSIVPETLNKFYQHEGADESANSQTGPIEFQNYPAILRSDNDDFATSVALPKWTIPANQTIGTFSPQPAAESALDEQYLVAMSPKASKWYWTVADWQYG
jgi:subtilase family serine protease